MKLISGSILLSSLMVIFNPVNEPLTKMVFVPIPGGTFVMGSPQSENGYSEEIPQHRVTIAPFEMMTTEVTQGMWETVMGSNPSHFVGSERPVEKVSWNDVQRFINEMNRLDPGKGYRLPTEAEWEYACRAGTTTRYNTGDNESDLARAGWYGENADDSTHRVGLKGPNAWGLYDMHGNVWEWCSDWYGNYSGDPAANPVGPNDGRFRIKRGGAYRFPARECRSASRHYYLPTFSGFNYIGFRLVRTSAQ